MPKHTRESPPQTRRRPSPGLRARRDRAAQKAAEENALIDERGVMFDKTLDQCLENLCLEEHAADNRVPSKEDAQQWARQLRYTFLEGGDPRSSGTGILHDANAKEFLVNEEAWDALWSYLVLAERLSRSNAFIDPETNEIWEGLCGHFIRAKIRYWQTEGVLAPLQTELDNAESSIGNRAETDSALRQLSSIALPSQSSFYQSHSLVLRSLGSNTRINGRYATLNGLSTNGWNHEHGGYNFSRASAAPSESCRF
ncbi:hypothetical protein JCM11491_002429 [Sporobolomyces phaffii]